VQSTKVISRAEAADAGDPDPHSALEPNPIFVHKGAKFHLEKNSRFCLSSPHPQKIV